MKTSLSSVLPVSGEHSHYPKYPTSPVANLKDCIPAEELAKINQLSTAKATSAGVEGMFSTFGFVQNKLRNQLGVEKVAKLTFMFKSLNKYGCYYM